jgi:hypothetical protein
MELTFISSGSIFDYFLNATEPNFSLKPLTPLAPKYRFLLAFLFTVIAIYTQIVKAQTTRPEEKVQTTVVATSNNHLANE